MQYIYTDLPIFVKIPADVLAGKLFFTSGGSLAGVRVYNRVLTALEIQALAAELTPA